MHALVQMKLLVNLAQVDGKVEEKEKTYIVNIGKANNIPPDQVVKLLQQTHPIIVPDNLSADQKFEYISSLVQLMKIDERMYQEEIRFCTSIAEKLGYSKEVMIELMLHVKTTGMDQQELSHLKSITQKYLKKK